MKAKKNIDDLFKTGLKGFRAEPSGQVWEKIETGFFKGFVFNRWHYAAALLLLLLTAGSIWYFTSGRGTMHEQVVKTEQPAEHVQPDTETVKELNTNIPDINEEPPAGLTETNKTPALTTKPVTGKTDTDIQNSNFAFNGNHSEKGKVIAGSGNSLPPTLNLLYLDKRSVNITTAPDVYLFDQDNIPGMKKFLEKQRKSHFYTGASFMGGMSYYQSTQDQFTWAAGLSFGLTAGRFFFETGVDYQDMRERGIYSIQLRGYDSVGYYNKVTSFEVNPSNPNEITYNTLKVTVYDSIQHYTHTTPLFKYKYIKVPLLAGFRFYQKEKFSASVETGVILSMMVSKKIPEEAYYDPEYTVVRIINKTPERVDWNLLFQLGIRLNYRIHKSLSLSAEPVFTKYLNSVYDTEKGYSNKKPYNMGLKIGIYYGF